MKKALFAMLLALSLLTLGLDEARAQNNDFMYWTELKITHPIKNSKFDFFWGMENRLDMDASRYALFNTTTGFWYKFFPWFKAGFAFRFEKETGKNAEFRPEAQAIFSYKLSNVKFQGRNRFESRNFTNGVHRFRYRLRIKVGPKYKVGIITLNPFVANEVLIEINKDPGGYNQNRFFVGNAFGFCNGKVSFAPYFLLRSDKKTSGWIKRYVFGTTLELKF